MSEAEPAGEFAQLVGKGWRDGIWGGAFFEIGGVDMQDAAGAIAFEVDAGGDAIAVEEGEHVVSVGALVFWRVETDAVVEIEGP